MDVTATGSAPLSADAAVPLRALPDIANAGEVLAAALQKSSDSIAPLLRLLAEPGIQHLLQGVEQRVAVDASRIHALVAEAVSAVERHHLPETVRALSQLVQAHPESAEQLVRDPAFAEVRSAVQGMVEHAKVMARTHAEATLTAAAAVPGAPGELNPQHVISIANQFYETGQYVNYLRAAALGEAVIGYRNVPRRAGKSPAREITGIAAALWKRAPLLVLLALWFCVGLIGGVVSWISGANAGLAFDIWAIGFLALVGFQFYANVRKST